MGIVVIGAVFVDIKGYPLATYIPGGRNAGRVEQVHGGVCRNVAEDIANVELRPTFVSLVDDTGTGQDVIDKLARHKVNTRYIQRVPDGMGTWLAVFNNEGDVVAAISKRPDTNPLTDLLAEKGDEIFKDCDGIATYIPGGRNAGRVEQVHGGVCRNVAEDIANVELRPTFVSLVDDTGTGQDVIDKLARHKVNTRYIQRVPDGMGTWLAVFNNEGDVVAAISKRPDTNPLTDLLAEKGDEIFKDCDGIAIELDLEKDTVKQVLYFAQKYHKKVYAAVSNMSIAMERRDFLQQIDCFVCNQQEAGILFSDEYDHMGPEEMCRTLAANVGSARIPCMVVTMGDKGAVYACADGESGIVPAKKVNVIDTTGAGDAFFAGTVIGRAYGKTMAEACGIGSRLAASVICTAENVCPRFRPQEFGLDVPVVD